MHNATHPFRNAYKRWKDVTSKRPLVRRVQWVLFWLPTFAVFTEVGCTVRAVTGNSMQVRTQSTLSQQHVC
jgi:hypothetical protein